MYCYNCGSEVNSDKAFCDACGGIIKIDGIIQQNAVSDSPISAVMGIRGQVAQSKYIAMSICIVLMMTGITLYTVFGKHDTIRNYSDIEYQKAVATTDSSSGKQNDKYAKSSNERDMIELDDELGYTIGSEKNGWNETDEEDFINNENVYEPEENEILVESDNTEFLCEFSSSRLITQKDMDILLSQGIDDLPDGRELYQMIIKEIYARHGYSFKNKLVLVSKWVGKAIWPVSQLPLHPCFYGNNQYLSLSEPH